MSAIAVVDVGSNSIKVAVVDGHDRNELGRLTESVRLQQDANPGDPLSLESQDAAAAAIGRLLDFARAKGATKFTVLGTSAVRDCANRLAFAGKVRTVPGVPLPIGPGAV